MTPPRPKWRLDAVAVRRAVDERHMTLSQLALELGVGRSTVNDWLGGKPVSPRCRRLVMAHPLLKALPGVLAREEPPETAGGDG